MARIMRDRESTDIYRCIQSEEMYDGGIREIVVGPYPTKQWLANSHGVHGRVTSRRIQKLTATGWAIGKGPTLDWVDVE